jgi:hypothetical protein
MEKNTARCPDCDAAPEMNLDRRDFFKAVGTTAAAAAATGLPLWATPRVQAAPSPSSAAETAVKALYETLTDQQKEEICFDWDYKHPKLGLLRTYVSANWHITSPPIRSDFFTKKQQHLIHDVFKGIINPEWYARFLKQTKDDTEGQEWGAQQNIALFGKPGTEKFEFVITGRHMTLRADGNTEAHVAFGGPIFYGHQASDGGKGGFEKNGHPGNVFWHQGVMANKVYSMLDTAQQAKALLATSPRESAVAFRKGQFPGIAVGGLSADQKQELQKVLMALVEPFRKEDREEALECLQRQGGLDGCGLSFYKDNDLGNDGVWDIWRLEGPAFVWHFRGYPHVHVWVNVADDPTVKLNAPT